MVVRRMKGLAKVIIQLKSQRVIITWHITERMKVSTLQGNLMNLKIFKESLRS